MKETSDNCIDHVYNVKTNDAAQRTRSHFERVYTHFYDPFAQYNKSLEDWIYASL